MRINVLGPIEVIDDNDVRNPIELQGQRQRALLASLILGADQVVSIDRLIDAIWCDEPPGSALTKVRGHISSLRKLLSRAGGDIPLILTHPPGYMLSTDRIQIDKSTHDDLVLEGRRALSTGDPRQATELFTSALSLWRGPAFADVASASIRREADSLEETRMLVLEDCVEADLQLGQYIHVISTLSPIVAAYPLRERIRAQLMLAMYRRGYRAEALTIYRTGHQAMINDLGLEPGPPLRRLHQLILNDDCELHFAALNELLDPTPGTNSRLGSRRSG